jgi:glycosyltransferase involved in cell wall biosynthesis
MAEKKIIVLHDYLQHKGGGERFVLTLARRLHSKLVVGFKAVGAFEPKDFGVDCEELGKEINYPAFRYFAIQWWFRHKTKFLREYDIVIFSANCIQAVHQCRSNARKIFYCHTPHRNAYDLYEFYKSRMPWWKKIAYAAFCALIRFNYERDLKKIDVIVANSETIQQRIKKYLRRDSVVVYPPIDTKKFAWIGQGDYYLSYSRVDLVKRVTDIAEAFKQMPDKKLVIASTGTEVERLKELIKDTPNISYVGRVSDEELKNLVGNCLANIYIPKDEDFGMTVLEGMAAGKPCLGVAEGGLRETISHEKDGYLLSANPSIEDIKNGVAYLTTERCLAMKMDCQKKAHSFREEVFIEQMKAVIEGKKS